MNKIIFILKSGKKLAIEFRSKELQMINDKLNDNTLEFLILNDFGIRKDDISYFFIKGGH